MRGGAPLKVNDSTEATLDPMDCVTDATDMLDPVISVEQAGSTIYLDESAVAELHRMFADFFEDHPERTRRYIIGNTSFLIAPTFPLDLTKPA